MTNKNKIVELPNVILDINADLKEKLSESEKEYFDTLTPDRKEPFLNMATSDRAKVMEGSLSEEEEKYAWRYASTLALHYINEGYMLKNVLDKLAPLAKGLLFASALSLCADFYFNVYAKNAQLHLENLKGPEKYELDAALIPSYNNSRENINDSTHVMSVDAYKAYISKAGFACGKLESITSSFFQEDGKPLCKLGENGDIFVAGYVRNPTFPQPAFNVIHNGKVYNIDMSHDAAITFAALPGAQTVTFKNISYAFHAAFPEAVRQANPGVVQRKKETQQ
jgi:hypothetical protein